jgi:hypothetical protein
LSLRAFTPIIIVLSGIYEFSEAGAHEKNTKVPVLFEFEIEHFLHLHCLKKRNINIKKSEGKIGAPFSRKPLPNQAAGTHGR